MNLENGEYIIRCFLDDLSNFCYISGPPNVNKYVHPQPSPHALVKRINRDTRTKKIRERDLPPECFVEVIHRDNYGTILLRQSATTRYATVYQEQTSSSIDGNAPKISFIKFPDDPTRGPIVASEFKLVAPTGNEADGVAILSMSTECYVKINATTDFLYPVCDDISQLPLQDRFVFEKRFGSF